VTPEECLPESLRGATVSRISRGLSGAGVYRVEANGQRYVLKISAETDPLETWRSRLAFQQLAADAGVAARVVHHDEARRAVVSEYVADRGFSAFFSNPKTREAALQKLGQLIARVHALPLPAGAAWKDPRESFTPVWASLGDFALPTFAREAIDRVLAEEPPPRERALVLSHNDPNPSNIVFDGERLLLLDWDSAGPSDPFFDLAALAMFLRMDDATTSVLIAAHDGTGPTAVPVYFKYARRLLAAVCGIMAFQIARRMGHAGGEVSAESAPTLADVYGGIGAGTLSMGSPQGLWAFALGLVRAIDA